MIIKDNDVQRRPLVVTVVALIDTATAIIPLVISLIGLSVLISAPDPRFNAAFVRCFGFFLLVGGLLGMGSMLHTAWAFYNLKPWAYRAVRAAAWKPQYWIVTRFGRRLDDEDVRAAFGLTYEARKHDTIF